MLPPGPDIDGFRGRLPGAGLQHHPGGYPDLRSDRQQLIAARRRHPRSAIRDPRRRPDDEHDPALVGEVLLHVDRRRAADGGLEVPSDDRALDAAGLGLGAVATACDDDRGDAQGDQA